MSDTKNRNLTYVVDKFQILAAAWRNQPESNDEHPLKERIDFVGTTLRDIQSGRHDITEEFVLQMEELTGSLAGTMGDDAVAQAMGAYQSAFLPGDMLLSEVPGSFPIDQRINTLSFDIRGPQYLSKQIKVSPMWSSLY